MEIENTKTKLKTAKKRCPKGTRLNPKTQLCDAMSEELKTHKTTLRKNQRLKKKGVLAVEPTASVVEKGSKKKCPHGTRKDPKTGICIAMTEEQKKHKYTVRKNQRLKKNNKREPQQLEEAPEEPLQEAPEELLQEALDEPSEEPLEEAPEEPLEEAPEELLEEPLDDPSEGPLEEAPEGQYQMEEQDQMEEQQESSKGQQDPQKIKPIKVPTNKDSKEFNTFLLNQEREENDDLVNSSNRKIQLYPTLNDPDFSYKIALHAEFADTKYDGEIKDIEKTADILCNAKFELTPHQIFVKNFLSLETPYNSLLLYHGLGSGKTCSAIGVAEENRSYMKQLGINKHIIVVAAPNVQDNFRLQLFDEKKLAPTGDGQWNLNTCVGNSLLQEINPTNLKGLTRERIISQINTIIKQYYVFMGYIELANYIVKKTFVPDTEGYSEAEKKEKKIRKIKQFFNNRFIIIDEIQNIRISESNKTKKMSNKTAVLLREVAKHSDNMRLLLLSATPMYNSHDEIIWITNLMNINDGRGTIDSADVFSKDGDFKDNGSKDKKEDGRELLKRKLSGYVSYVRGENPFLFPYRIYPQIFAPGHSLESIEYPRIQLNGKTINPDNYLKYIPIYVNGIGSYQKYGYDFILRNMMNSSSSSNKMPDFENMESFGYTMLYGPLEALNIVYPSEKIDKMISKWEKGKMADADFGKENVENSIIGLIGEEGLKNVMKWSSKTKPYLHYDFEYKATTVKKYGRIFSPEELPKYSAKISGFCNTLKQSTGIVLICSQFISGGTVPIALALEEMGFAKYGSDPSTRNLFKSVPHEPIDAITMKTRKEMEQEGLDTTTFRQARYTMITGDRFYSADNNADVKYVTDPSNKNGENVKVIIISKAGAEGVDFKYIRQVHVLESWYNMNLIEQIIGRGVRNLSHCGLPFKQRNVEIYLHTTVDKDFLGEPGALLQKTEYADMYVYRVAERKTQQIGRVTRLLKEVAVDCLLNIGQTNFTEQKLYELAQNKHIEIELSSGTTVPFKVGDKPFTDVCDYMDNCAFKCSVSNEKMREPIEDKDLIQNTYNTSFLITNSNVIIQKIKNLFKDKHLYKGSHLISAINILKKYPLKQIYYSLTKIINSKMELVDIYGRSGTIINRGEYYAFQPSEINDTTASVYERIVPVKYKHASYFLELDSKKRIQREPSRESDSISFSSIMKKLTDSMDILKKRNIVIKSFEKNWYKHCNKVIQVLQDVHEIPMDMIFTFALHHFLDQLSIKEKIVIIRELYDSSKKNLVNIEKSVKSYFDRNILRENAIVLSDQLKNKYYIRNEDTGEWSPAEFTDENELAPLAATLLKVPKSKINNIVGFMHPFRSGDIAFKIKDMTQLRNTGALCENASKDDIISKIKSLVGEDLYDSSAEKYALCVILEMICRYKTVGYSTVDKDKYKVYFFGPESTLYNNIPKMKL